MPSRLAPAPKARGASGMSALSSLLGRRPKVAEVAASDMPLDGFEGSDVLGGDPDLNLPKANVAIEPCSACGREGVFFSNRQMRVDPAKRKCLECMPLGSCEAGVAMAGGGKDPPKANTSDEPCSMCCRTDVFFSNRQMKVDAASRRCLECMPRRGTEVAGRSGNHEAAHFEDESGEENTADEPCSSCGRTDVRFSNRQMKVNPAERRCLDCMPSRTAGQARTKEEPPAFLPEGTLLDLPKANQTPEPCSACGRYDAFFSNRQMKVDPAFRRCLECMPGTAGVPTADQMPLDLHMGQDLPKPVPADDPCSSCGRLGVMYSKRQIKLDPNVRRCLECMTSRDQMMTRAAGRAAEARADDLPQAVRSPDPCARCGKGHAVYSKRQMRLLPGLRTCLDCMSAGLPEERLRATGASLPPFPPLVPRNASVWARKRKVADVGMTSARQSPRAAMAALPLGPAGKDPPALNFPAEPCSACGRLGVPFSNRQMKFDAATRKCLNCMPGGAAVPLDTDMGPPPKRRKGGSEKGFSNTPPKQNIPDEPCEGCGRTGVPFSNRQMKFPPAERRCLECMEGTRMAKEAEARPPLGEETAKKLAVKAEA